MKYEIKTQKLALKLAEEIAKNGQATYEGKILKCLKNIQTAIGPNPLAVKRYEKKFGGNIKNCPRNILKTNQAK